MNWRKGKIDKLIFSNDGLVYSIELLVYQSKKEKLTTIKRPVQLVIPFELCSPNEPAETHTDNNYLKRLAAINADAVRPASDHYRHEMSPGGSVETPKKLIRTFF